METFYYICLFFFATIVLYIIIAMVLVFQNGRIYNRCRRNQRIYYKPNNKYSMVNADEASKHLSNIIKSGLSAEKVNNHLIKSIHLW